MSPEISVKIVTGLLLLVGLINFAPVTGLLSAAKLESAYGIGVNEPNLTILLRHRALLFGLVGGFILYSAFNPALQPIAFVWGFISMLGFIALCWQTGEVNPLLRKIAIIDVVGLILLLAALVLRVTR